MLEYLCQLGGAAVAAAAAALDWKKRGKQPQQGREVHKQDASGRHQQPGAAVSLPVPGAAPNSGLKAPSGTRDRQPASIQEPAPPTLILSIGRPAGSRKQSAYSCDCACSGGTRAQHGMLGTACLARHAQLQQLCLSDCRLTTPSQPGSTAAQPAPRPPLPDSPPTFPNPANSRSPSRLRVTRMSRVGRSTRCTPLVSTPRSAGRQACKAAALLAQHSWLAGWLAGCSLPHVTLQQAHKLVSQVVLSNG